MFKQFPLELNEAGASGLYDIRNFDITDRGLGPNNFSVRASIWVSVLFAWLRLYQNQATFAQPDVFSRRNRHAITKKL